MNSKFNYIADMKKQEVEHIDAAIAELKKAKAIILPEDTEGESLSKIVVLVDAGHGGNHPETGEYMTPASTGKRYTFDSGLDIREGVVNREIADKFCEQLSSEGIAYGRVYHEYEDTPMAERTQEANRIAVEAGKQGKHTVLISFHSNAHGMNLSGAGASARGWSVFTTVGVTKSDLLADLLYEKTKLIVGDEIRYRADYSDGDVDFEAQFWMLAQTTMPAILLENLFFTNIDDATLLLSEAYQNKSARAAVEAVVSYAIEYGRS